MRGLAPYLLLVAACAGGCADPTHEDAVAALGGEAEGVPEGPLHRPGQPCLTCHGSSGPSEAEFSLAGTVYTLWRQDRPMPGAVVRVEDFSGATYLIPTNDAGNFFIPRAVFTPKYPVRVKVSFADITQQMFTHISRAGSCSDCHVDPPSATSPGRVYIAVNPSELPPEFRP
jgi:hypothetical protein